MRLVSLEVPGARSRGKQAKPCSSVLSTPAPDKESKAKMNSKSNSAAGHAPRSGYMNDANQLALIAFQAIAQPAMEKPMWDGACELEGLRALIQGNSDPALKKAARAIRGIREGMRLLTEMCHEIKNY